MILGKYVVYWPPTPPNMPFQIRRKCIFHWRGRAWLTIWDRVKIPQYSHKLMHRKRACELHDSYFRSMTIKHAIPKTAEVHIQMASYGEILSGCWTVIKLSAQEIQPVWGAEELEKGCCRENGNQQRAGPPGLRLNSIRRTRKETLMAIRVGVNMLPFCSVSNSLLHTTLSNKVRGIYFSKKTVSLVFIASSLCCYDYVLCVCIVGHDHGYKTNIKYNSREKMH